MKNDKEILEELANELVRLWYDCKIKCEKIEDLGRQLEDLRK